MKYTKEDHTKIFNIFPEIMKLLHSGKRSREVYEILEINSKYSISYLNFKAICKDIYKTKKNKIEIKDILNNYLQKIIFFHLLATLLILLFLPHWNLSFSEFFTQIGLQLVFTTILYSFIQYKIKKQTLKNILIAAISIFLLFNLANDIQKANTNLDFFIKHKKNH